MDTQPAQQSLLLEAMRSASLGCAPPSPGREASPSGTAGFAPPAISAPDAPAACSDISDGQLLAMTDIASLTADQLDRRHHLLRHSLPDEARGESVLVHFEAGSVHEAVKMIKKMSQRDLQAKFKLVYGAKTFSNNNNWLRRKLFEAIGVDPAKGAVKKAAAGNGGRRRRAGAATARASARTVVPRTAAPRAAAARGGWYAAAAGAADWEPYNSATEQQAVHAQQAVQAQQDGQQYSQQGEQQYGYFEEATMAAEEGSEEGSEEVCAALLALGDAAASMEENDSFSEGSVPSVSLAASPEPSPHSAAAHHAELAAALAREEEMAEAVAGNAGGSAAFRHMLLQHHEAATAAAAAAAAAAVGAGAGPSAAEWMAAVQQHAAAVAGGRPEQAHALASHMHMQAAAYMHPMLAGGMGMLGHHSMMSAPGWHAASYAGLPLAPAAHMVHPAAAAAYGAHSPAMLGALRQFMGAQHAQQHSTAPPLFAK